MIVFKKLRWKNLLSTGNVFTEIDLNKCSQTLIVGENGAGKSTILDALSFALYGRPFRKVNKGQLLNSINNKQLVVELEFSVNSKDYLIRRGIKPNIFEVFQSGTLINLDASSSDYQEMLDKHILKINHKSFSQIVVLGSASFVPFMQLSAAHRREVIEDLLDIEIFTTMNTLLKTKVSTNRQAIQENSYATDTIIGKIELENLHIEEIKVNTEEVIKQKEQQVASLKEEMNEAQTEIDRLQTEVTDLLTSISDQDKVRSRLEKVIAIGRQLDSKSIKLQNETNFFAEHSDCPTCRQGIADEHRTSIVEKTNSQLAEVQQGREKISEELVRLNTRQSVISNVLNDISTKTTSISERNVRIRTLTGFVTSINNEIEQLKLHKQVDTNVVRLKELQDQQAALVLECEQLLIERNILDAASVILKDTGIKTKIIRQYIPIINKLINKYLASMDFFVNFELNENFEETIKSRFRDEFSYASFSEGEKSRIDLALLFTWRAVAKLRNSTSTNLLILDEVFDGSLDAQGNEELLKILQTITEGNNVFVISHKTDTYLDKFERVLKFQKQKNFSNMVEL